MRQTQVQSDWWDWSSVALLFVLLQVIAARLVATEWTEQLQLTQTTAWMGVSLGLALGYSRYKPATARWLSFSYLVVVVPLLLIRVIDEQVDWVERLVSVGGRLLVSLGELFANRPIEDPLFFIATMCLLFWVASVSAGFNLTRRQNFITTVVPSAVGLMVLQHYDNISPGRLLILAFYIFIALCLLGRLTFLQNQIVWRARRIFISPENRIDLSTSMAVVSAFLIVATWVMPAKLPRVDTIRDTWRRLITPWTRFTDRMENAVSALDATKPGQSSEFYGANIELGQGFPLTEALMFRVQVPEFPLGQEPPRYYWRGKAYDVYEDGRWSISATNQTEFSPEEVEIQIADQNNGTPAVFTFTLGTSRSSLIYAPAQPIWVSRPGRFLAGSADGAKDIFSWNTTPALQPGETYQVNAVVNNPYVEELRAAGTAYPQWVTEKYLQMPDDFSLRLTTLAQEITAGAETPYDQTLAITRYLRENLTYAPTLSAPPRRADPLEWVVFEYKQAYCMYYATAEVMMLRSLGVPARLAVGFAQGEEVNVGEAIDDIRAYRVVKKNAHAWPEVYFPGIGWVEFEPTGNQAPLQRPLQPGQLANGFINRQPNLPDEDLDDNTTNPEPDVEENTDLANQTDLRLSPTLYLSLLLVVFATLIFFINRRYNLPTRAPSWVRAGFERTGFEVPRWVQRWEVWITLTPIERAFNHINIALRQLKHPAPTHATPRERAESLAKILPHLQPVIKILLDEHNTSLYTSRTADEKKAQQAAFQIRIQTSLARLRQILTGRHQPDPT